MAENVQINLNARNNAGPAIKQVQTELSGLGRAAGSAGQGLAGLGGALAGGALFGAAIAGVQALGSAVMDLAQGAAQLETLQNSFSGLAAGVGQSSDDMLAALRNASAGMIADRDLILAANKAMLLGVADSTDDMVALMDIARVRGAAMGLSMTQAFDNIVTGLGRGSALILDNLGIMVDIDGINRQYADSLGKTVAALSAQEQKQALVNAVLSDTARMAGDAASGMGETAVAIGSMGAAWQNLKDQLGTLVSPAVATAMQGLADALNAVNNEISENKIIAAERDLFAMGDSVTGLTERLRALQAAQPFAESLGTFDAGQISNELEMVSAALASVGQQYNEAAAQTGAPLLDLAQLQQGIVSFGGMTQAVTETGAAMSDADTRAQALGDALSIAETGMSTASGAAQKLTGDLSVMAGIAASAGVDLANLGAAADAMLGRVNAAIAGAQGLRSAAISKVQSQALQLADQGLISNEQVIALVAEATDEISNMGLSYDQTTEAALQNALAVQNAAGIYTDYFDAISEADRESKRLASEGLAQAKKAANEAAQAFESLVGKVQGVLQESLTLDGINVDDILPREDAVNENARRLAAIANEGLIGQDWLEQFKSQVPDIYQALVDSGDPQGAAAAMLRDFQDGLVPDLLDKDRAKELVKRALTGEASMAALAQEIAAELSSELGVALPQAQAAAFASLGVKAPGATGVGEGAAEELTNETTLKGMAKAGAEAAATWGVAFLDRVAEGVPGQLIEMLTTLITPQVQAKLQAAQTQGAPIP